jgi:hypothetical protein
MHIAVAIDFYERTPEQNSGVRSLKEKTKQRFGVWTRLRIRWSIYALAYRQHQC